MHSAEGCFDASAYESLDDGSVMIGDYNYRYEQEILLLAD